MAALRLLDDSDLDGLPFSWSAATATVRDAVAAIKARAVDKPLKPALRFPGSAARIFAMPALVGGEVQAAGIKWVASFPANTAAGLPRAHSVYVLNCVRTGAPRLIYHGQRLNELRTAAISLAVLERLLDGQRDRRLRLGIVGFGRIGQAHWEGLTALFGDRIEDPVYFDVAERPVRGGPRRVDSLDELIGGSDLVVTATTSRIGYIDCPPRPESIHLNVSLRDYRPAMRRRFDQVVVDDWEEVCRAETDIELMHKAGLLSAADCQDFVAFFDRFAWRGSVFVNPFGLATFDIAIANYVAGLAEAADAGRRL